MNFVEFKAAAADYFTTAEFIELIDIDTEELIVLLEENGYFNGDEGQDVQSDIEEIMGVSDDE